ncbi:unnamed protein product [Scytosiphon promiscuus]
MRLLPIFAGTIPKELGRLTALRELSLGGNNLSGSIPSELGALRELRALQLDRNQLAGRIPESLRALSELQELCLDGNHLTGPIPPELGMLEALTSLELGNNQLTGPIPPELGNLAALQSLYLELNKLSGPIPSELGALAKLEQLLLYNNQLEGPIPKTLGGLSKLESLSLACNQLTGAIPEELGKLTVLEELSLSRNNLSEIPPEVLKLYRRNTLGKYWDSNAWSRPPLTVLESGIESALGWWKDAELLGVGKSNRLKMVLVGLAEAGKTTVVRHLTGGSILNLPDRTVGIEITDWRPLDEVPLRVSVWDFSGQADYYASHQLFLTKGALFLLVVDLHAFSKEVQSAVDDFTDPRGRIYWWLEMLYMRVPGAAIALVGSHVDDMEKEGLDADSAGKHLHEVVRKFIEEKAKNASRGKSNRSSDTQSTITMEADYRREGGDAFPLAQGSSSSRLSAEPLVLHDHVFKVSLDAASVCELQEWVVHAASGRECPQGFKFRGVDQIVPKAWIEACDAVEVVTTPCVLWSEAVASFSNAMRGDLTHADDLGKVLLRAMQHRKAEGGVMLSQADASAPLATDLLHVDPSWLMELMRRLTDHNIVLDDEEKQRIIMRQLETYAEKQHVEFGPLRHIHRVYCKSGRLNREYLRFLWMFREIEPPGPAVDLNESNFESIISTMVRLLVMYRARGEADLVVPARLPEYGHQGVPDPDNIVEIVVVMTCSFGQLFHPPGIVGRFLAWLTQVDEYGECWQHGAFVSYKSHKVCFFESEDLELQEDPGSKFAGLTLGVQGLRNEAGPILEELKASLKQLVSDSAHGYPGLAMSMHFGELAETSSSELLALRLLLDNSGERPDKMMQRLGGVANQVLESMMWATIPNQDECPYPRLAIVAPETEEYGTERQFRLRFLCAYDFAEVPCGPDGRGYLIKTPKPWLKIFQMFATLMQASRLVLLPRMSTVPSVDLAMNEVVDAVFLAKLDGIKETARTIKTDRLDETVTKIQESEEYRKAYKSMCESMREAEAPPPRRWLGFPSRHRESSPPPVHWKDSMVQERNGNGGWDWVLRSNREAFIRDRDDASAASTRIAWP